jgi:hypothetical protein
LIAISLHEPHTGVWSLSRLSFATDTPNVSKLLNIPGKIEAADHTDVGDARML